jgi:hypothetical protein
MEDFQMKKIVSILLAAVLVLSLAATAFAADGINADEEALLVKFCAAVDQYAEKSPAHAMQFKNEATSALMKLDLDAAACADLSAGIDKVVAYAEANGITTKAAAKDKAADVLALVNGLVAKYGISVSLSDTLYATVCFTAADGNGAANTDKASNGGAKIVKQTGVDMTATYAVAAVLVVALVFGMAVVTKKNLLSNN